MTPVDELVADWRARGRPLAVTGAATRVWREGAGPPVVLLHGVPASAYLYRRVLPALAARGIEGIAFDLPGLGCAERPAAFDYRWSSLAAWVEQAVDALGLERFHLVVHDIGGPIGFELVARVPDRIASLTALNTLVRVASFRRPWTMEPFAWPLVGALALASVRPWLFERLMRLQGVLGPIPSVELRAYRALLVQDDGGRAFLRIMRGFERTPAFERRIVAALATRRFPAQVLWGESDPALPLVRIGEDVRLALGVPEITTLPGKHFLQEDCPKEIAEAIARLVAEAR
jgi:pimeloyl-ACP methyl ester carboxylesterase